MKLPFKLLCITLCLSVLFCMNSYSQAASEFKKIQTKQNQRAREVQVYSAPTVEQIEFIVPEVHADGYIIHEIQMDVAGEMAFTQKTFSAPLFDDQISVESTNISPRSYFKNLEVYLIYGNAETDKKKYVPLHEALKNNMAKINETSTVNKLSISNNSDQYIYINSGDIVKGGKQDRTIKYDIVVAPHAQNVDLASFCVERSRWSQRGNEEVYAFLSSEKSLSSSDLKVAARHNSNQSEVWKEVKDYQVTTNTNLNTDAEYIQTITKTPGVVTSGMSNTTQNVNVGEQPVNNVIIADVTRNASSSSLELTLESKALNAVNEEYKKTVLDQLGNRDGAVGMAYFINGKLYSIEVFNNHQLFSDLFDKLLDAAIAEAISVTSTNAEIPQGNLQEVKDFLKADAKVYEELAVNSITQARTSENNINKDMWIFSTIDLEEKTWLHRNWIIK